MEGITCHVGNSDVEAHYNTSRPHGSRTTHWIPFGEWERPSKKEVDIIPFLYKGEEDLSFLPF